MFPVEKGKKTGREEEENGLQLQRYSRVPPDEHRIRPLEYDLYSDGVVRVNLYHIKISSRLRGKLDEKHG